MAPKKKQGKFQQKKTQKSVAAENYTQETKPASKPTVLVLTALCLCVSILASVFFLGKLGIRFTLPSKTIASGVSVAGVDVGGLTRSEAEDAVTAAVGNTYAETPMVVTVHDKTLEIAPQTAAAEFDVDGAVADAFKYGTEANSQLQVDILSHLTLNTQAIREQVTEFGKNFPTDGVSTGSQIIQETVDGQQQDVLEITIGTNYYDFSADDLYNVILSAYNDHRFTAVYTCSRMDAASVDLDALYAQYCTEPVDAVLDPETYQVTQSAAGYSFDFESAKEALARANPGDVLKFPFADVPPSVDTETLQSMLFRDELASYTAYQSSSSDRATNLRLACEALDGLVLYPGDTFSYNKTLGERTPEKGYRPAASYMNGETVQSYGGGICQPSSALYYVCLHADLEIVQRHCHSYPSSYVPLGMDATVDWSGPDFEFKNNTDYPIRIEAEADGGSVTVKLIGTDTKDYYVKMEYEILSVSNPKTEYIEVEPGSGHKDGEVKTTAYTGYTVQTYKLKYDKETNELISREKEAYSAYSKRDKVVYKVKAEEPTEEDTTPTETKPTESKPTEPETTLPETTVPETTAPETTEPETTEPETTEPETTEPETTAPETTVPETTVPETTAPETAAPDPTVDESDSDADTPDE